LGTAAWKLSPVASVAPDTWNRAKIITTPGFAADVCGVRVILSSFLSYALYDVRRGAGGATGVGGDWDWGKENAELADAARVYNGVVDGGKGDVVTTVALLVPKSPRMSSTVVRCVWGGEEAPEADGDVDPKISARRSWLFWAVGAWPLTGVDKTSSPKRSAYHGEVSAVNDLQHPIGCTYVF
jgi:hypothetical protein